MGVLSEEYSENILVNFVPGSQSRMMAWPDKVSVPSLLLNIASKTSANLKQISYNGHIFTKQQTLSFHALWKSTSAKNTGFKLNELIASKVKDKIPDCFKCNMVTIDNSGNPAQWCRL